jgi:SNF2 family DNA or RNA helicase
LGDIDEDKPLITLDNLYESLDKLNQRLYQAENELEGKTTTFNFFNNVINRLRKTASKETDMKKKAEFELDLNGDKSVMDLLNEMDDSDSDSENEEDEDICGICYDEIPENDVGVTKCGHIFCYECLKIAISQYHKCPMCQKKLKDTEVWMLSYEKKKKTDEPISPEDKQKDELIDEIGTKLANLIFYLRETDEHVILLRKVGKILKDNKIKNVFCKGNCYQRDKAIREFNSDDKIKVIMLSSDSSASGTNLTKASQVIMLDPIYGNYKYRKDQEKQAVGRAHRLGQTKNIQVLRFIVKDSVEEEIYWMNINEDKKHTENITIQKSDNVEESE